MITKEGLGLLTQDLRDRKQLLFRNRKVKRGLAESERQRKKAFGEKEEDKKEEETVKYDPEKPLKLRFKILQNYLEEYERKKGENKE